MPLIPLTKGAFAIVCDCHYDLVALNKWYFDDRYAHRKQWFKDEKRYKGIRMHQVVCPAPKAMDVDHINRNKLDNRCSNLRVCSRSENLLNKGMDTKNTSGFEGVGFDKSRGKWMAYWNQRGYPFKNLGRYDTKEEARIARENYVILLAEGNTNLE